MRHKHTWDERFLDAYAQESLALAEAISHTPRHRRLALVFAPKAQALGLDPRKSGLLAARLYNDLALLEKSQT